MKLFNTLWIAIFFTGLAYGQAPDGYYDDAEGLSGFALKTALNQIIDGIDDGNGFPSHQDQGYDALYGAYANPDSGDTDDYYENDGTVLDMYSEQPNSSDSYNYNHFSQQCGNYNGEASCYNREHLVPQSTFNSASPMKNDYFHVVPTDGYVNGMRSNHPFGEVGSASFTSTNGSQTGSSITPGYNGTVFEPIDEFKGDIARSVLYFAVRYEEEINGGWSTNNVLTINDPSQFYQQWYIDLLISWHLNDPVSQREIDRNNNGYIFQGNRNPFIDHPEYVQLIWDPDPDTEAPTAPINLEANSITDSSLELSWEAATDNMGIAGYEVWQDGELIASTDENELTYDVNGLTPETTYDFVVYAVDTSANTSEPSNTLTVTTLSGADFVFEENFDNCFEEEINFMAISEASYIDWECNEAFGENDSGSYQINAFDDGQVPSLDWLITNVAIDFDNLDQAYLSFYAKAAYGNTNLELLYSSDYDGGENPSDFTWESVPEIDIPSHSDGSGSEEVHIFSAEDISEIEGQVYIAFKYDTTNGEEATRWTVDSFLLEGNSLRITTPEQLDVKLYPNPNTTKQLYFESREPLTEITIYSINGRKIQHNSLSTKQKSIAIEQLSAGVYLVEMRTVSSKSVKKLIVR
ncbi:MAG: endonuclease [Bacteroidota bacterium]